jgi:hypothetical protein
MSDEPLAPAIESQPERPAPPPPRIVHFLLWICTSSVLLAAERGILASIPIEVRQDLALLSNSLEGALWWVVSAAMSGGQVSIAIVAIWWKSRRITAAIEPGEWISIYSSAVLLIGLLSCWLSVCVGTELTPWLLDAALETTAVIALVLAIRRSSPGLFWIVALALMVVPQSIAFLMRVAAVAIAALPEPALSATDDLATRLETLAGVAMLLTVVLAACYDLRNSQRRRWSHWVGVAIPIVESALIAALWLSKWR